MDKNSEYYIDVDELFTEDISEYYARVIKLMTEVHEEIYEDMKVIDDMQSKYLDVVCDEITYVRDALEELSDLAQKHKNNAEQIYQRFAELDNSRKV